MQPAKTLKKAPGENITIRIPADLLKAIDAEIKRLDDGEEVTRSIVIRDAIRKQLMRSKNARKAELLGKSLLASIPRCNALGCNVPATNTENELDRAKQITKWWCDDHRTPSSVPVELVAEVRAVPRPDWKVVEKTTFNRADEAKRMEEARNGEYKPYSPHYTPYSPHSPYKSAT